MTTKELFKSYVNICKKTDSIQMESLIADIVDETDMNVIKHKYNDLNGGDLNNAIKLKKIFGDNAINDYCDIYNNYHENIMMKKGGASLFGKLSSTFKKIDPSKIQSAIKKIDTKKISQAVQKGVQTSVQISKKIAQVSLTLVKKFFANPDAILSILNTAILAIVKVSLVTLFTSIEQNPELYDKIVDKFDSDVRGIVTKVNTDINSAIASIKSADSLPGIGPMIGVLSDTATKFNNLIRNEVEKAIAQIMTIMAVSKEVILATIAAGPIEPADKSQKLEEPDPLLQSLQGLPGFESVMKNIVVANEIVSIIKSILDPIREGIVVIINSNKKSIDSIISTLEKLAK